MTDWQVAEIDGFKIAHRVGTDDELQLRQSFESDILLPGISDVYTPEPGHTVIDVGAHIGTFALWIARRVHPGIVCALEPWPESFSLLSTNIGLNSAHNVSERDLALWKENGPQPIYRAEVTRGHSMTTGKGRGVMVSAATLPFFLNANGIERVDLLKLNCEGAEFAVFASTPPKVLERIQTILCLYHCDLCPDGDPADIVQKLSLAGFDTEIKNVNEKIGRGWIVGAR